MYVCPYTECSQLTEEGLSHLVRLTGLWYLHLRGLPCVTDGVLDRLHGCSRLWELYLGDTDLTSTVGLFSPEAVCRSVKLLLCLQCLPISSPQDGVTGSLQGRQLHTPFGTHRLQGSTCNTAVMVYHRRCIIQSPH